jgi:hypothetical protein
MLFLVIVVLGLVAAPARADNSVYGYCWVRGVDTSDVTHEFVTDVVQILPSQRMLFEETVAQAIDAARFQHFDIKCDVSADSLEIQQRHQREYERLQFTFEQSREGFVAPENIALNLSWRVPRSSSTVIPIRGTVRRAALADVSKCAEYVGEVDGGVASIKNHCKQEIWVTYCYDHPLPDTAASRIDCAKGSFGGAGPLAEGAHDRIPPGNGVTAILFTCPYPDGRLDLGKGIGKMLAVTPTSRYRCARI